MSGQRHAGAAAARGDAHDLRQHPADDVVLRIEGLSKRFRLPGTHAVVHACDDINLTVRRGETLGVIGESGSGKTTLGRCLLRLIEPTEGEIYFKGTPLSQATDKEMRGLRRNMQIVFQEPFESFNPQMSVGRQITEPLRIHLGLSKQERDKRALELLDHVRLPRAVAHALPATLSPGVLQRASIARAIATSPDLIVLDEPTSVLPPEAEEEVIALLRELQRELGLAYVFISHDLSLVEELCDRVAVMYLGQVVECGNAAEIFTTPLHPYSQALLAAVLRPDPRQARNRGKRLEGEIPSPIDLPSGCYLASRCPAAVEACTRNRQELRAVEGHDDRLVRCERLHDGTLKARSATALEEV